MSLAADPLETLVDVHGGEQSEPADEDPGTERDVAHVSSSSPPKGETAALYMRAPFLSIRLPLHGSEETVEVPVDGMWARFGNPDVITPLVGHAVERVRLGGDATALDVRVRHGRPHEGGRAVAEVALHGHDMLVTLLPRLDDHERVCQLVADETV